MPSIFYFTAHRPGTDNRSASETELKFKGENTKI